MAQVLERSLDALTSDERMALIARLAPDAGHTGAELAQPPAKTTDLLLTTAEVATRLEVSRPYIAMLCDAGKLGNVVKTEDGHRCARQAYGPVQGAGGTFTGGPSLGTTAPHRASVAKRVA